MTAFSLRATRPLIVSPLRWARVVLTKHRPLALLLRVAMPAAVFSIFGAIFVASGPADMDLSAEGAPGAGAIPLVLIGFLIVGQIVVLVSCSWLHLREITSKELGLSYTVFPSRAALVGGEALVALVVGAVASLISVVLAFAVYAFIGGVGLRAMFSSAVVITAIVRVPLTVAVACVIALALAVILRNPFFTVLVVVAWSSVGEDMLARIPGIGQALQSAAPLANGYYFSGMTTVPALSDNPWLCLLWLVAVCAIVLGTAVIVESRRKGNVH